ncbi:MAG: hypothetical protein ABN483_16805, partial [Pantoea agglomerans]
FSVIFLVVFDSSGIMCAGKQSYTFCYNLTTWIGYAAPKKWSFNNAGTSALRSADYHPASLHCAGGTG